MSRFCKRLILACALGIGGLVPATSSAQSIKTTGDTDPLYNGTDLPWSVGGILRIGDDANGTLEIKDGATVSNTFGYVGNDVGVLGNVLLTNGSGWTNSGALFVGFSGTGTVDIESSSIVSNDDAYLGYLFGSSGTVHVSNAQWDSLGAIYVGRLGDGSLTIDTGAKVTGDFGVVGAFAGQGSAAVAGANSIWDSTGGMFVGIETTGELSITAGGQVLNTDASLGQTAFGTGTVTVAGTNSKWTNAGDLRVGEAGSGTLSISSGGQASANAVLVGELAGSDGSVTLAGTGSEFEHTGLLTVGKNGQGSVRVESGAQLTSNGGATIGDLASGSVTVTGADSMWTLTESVLVGNTSDGQLDILNGGKVVVDRSLTAGGIINETYNGVGTINVSGAGSTLEVFNNLQLGFQGRGIMNVSDQGYVFVEKDLFILDGELNVTGGGDVRVDSSPVSGSFETRLYDGGKLTVSGAGSSVIAETGKIRIGYRGTAELIVESGGFLGGGISVGNLDKVSTPFIDESGTGHVIVRGVGTTLQTGFSLENNSTLLVTDGAYARSSGGIDSNSTATFTGAGTTFESFSVLQVGRNDVGFLDIEAGATAMSGEVILGFTGWGNVTVSDDATWSISDWFTFGGHETTSFGGTGILTIEDDALVTADGTIKLWGSSQIILTGGLLDAATIDLEATASISFGNGALQADAIIGDLIQDGGQFSPGNSPGLTDITGDYEHTAGTLLMEIAGLGRGTDYDAIDLTGDAVLSGTIKIDVLDGVSLADGDSFFLIDASSITGTPTFDFTEAALGAGLAWDTSDFLTSGTLRVQVVPEPSAALYVLGLLGLGMGTRRFNRRAA